MRMLSTCAPLGDDTPDGEPTTLLLVEEQPPILLDGFTTWLERTGCSAVLDSVAADVWFAPRAFARGDDHRFTALIDATNSVDAPQGDPAASAAGFAVGHLADGRIAARVGRRRYVGSARLVPDVWNHLRMRIEPSGITLGLGDTEELVDAQPQAAVRVPDVIIVGRSAHDVDGMPRACAVGLLARASVTLVRDDAPDGPIRAPRHGDGVDTTPPRSRYVADPHRPIAHVTAPQGWMNEPHGPMQVDGTHHLFYQHNPAGPYWDHISWGHATSPDLVHWRDESIAVLAGPVPLAADGVWSGSSVRGDAGEHLLFVTAGAFARTPDQSIAIARPDGARWSVDATPVIEMPPTVDAIPLVAGQFRDPFVWREADGWFLLVGAGLEGRGGTALLYRSADGQEWEPCGPLLVGDVGRHPATGVMWELPVLLPVGHGVDGAPRHALFIAPWWAGPSEHHLQHVWHWIGTWDPRAARFRPDHDEPREFDGGGHLTGPSGTVLEDGRSILWTIAQDKRSEDDQLSSGWAHNAGFPVELGLSASGSLTVRPVAELALLRDELLVPEGRRVRGRHLDVEFVAEGSVELDVFMSDDGRERTTLGVAPGRVWIDRSWSSLDPAHCESERGIDRGPGPATTRCRLLLDGSMLELWVDDAVAITSRAYTDLAGDLVALRPSPDARILQFDAFRIHSAYRP